jgi:hypothetical protein
MPAPNRDLDEATQDICRREFLVLATMLGTGLALVLDGTISPVFALPPCQERWAHCINCNMLFFDGYKDKGRCPGRSNQAHIPEKRAGSIKPYYLAYDDSTGPGQGDWRYCAKCKVLFYNGYPQKGVCPGDGKGHEAAGWNFFLYHDRPQRTHEEAGWHFCSKCNSLFYTRASNNSGCPADGKGHQLAGYKFLVGQRGQCIDEPCPKPECRI